MSYLSSWRAICKKSHGLQESIFLRGKVYLLYVSTRQTACGHSLPHEST